MTGLSTVRTVLLRHVKEPRELVTTDTWIQRLTMSAIDLVTVATCVLIITHKSHMCACGGGGPFVVP